MNSEIKQLNQLKHSLGPKGWIEDPNVIEPYLVEERGLFIGNSALLLKPSNTKEVSDIIRLCNTHKIKIVPQGGRTGLCGGTIPSKNGNEVMLSLERMNKISYKEKIENLENILQFITSDGYKGVKLLDIARGYRINGN